jgi:hypothetical protein
MVDCDQSSSDDEPQDMYVAEMVWPKEAKSQFVPLYSRFKINSKKRLNLCLMLANVIKYSMNYSRVATLKNHTISSTDELKRHAYYKWHNSFSHATNDCNMFRR